MTKSRQIRLMIVDDHAVVRSGLSAFLSASDGVSLVGEASGGEEGVRLCREMKPDVVLMDLVMPGMDGIAATRAMKQSCPKTQVIALTSFAEDERVQAALEAGAIGYLVKNVSGRELIDAVRNAVAGQPTLSPEAAQALIHTSAGPQASGLQLTQREREVLAMMVKGFNNTEIAERLAVSASTAKFHIGNVLSKLGVGTRSEAVDLAIRNHLADSG